MYGIVLQGGARTFDDSPRATLVWCLVGTMATMTIVSFALTGLSVDLRSNPWLPLAIAGLMSASVFYRYRRPDPAMTDYESYFLIAVLFFTAVGWHFYINR